MQIAGEALNLALQHLVARQQPVVAGDRIFLTTAVPAAGSNGGLTEHKFTVLSYARKTGKLLWEGDLPYAGNATPSIYMIDGKQYVVIATSGSRNPKGPQGAAYIAFALP